MTRSFVAGHIFPSNRTRRGNTQFIYVEFMIVHLDRPFVLQFRMLRFDFLVALEAKTFCYNSLRRHKFQLVPIVRFVSGQGQWNVEHERGNVKLR